MKKVLMFVIVAAMLLTVVSCGKGSTTTEGPTPTESPVLSDAVTPTPPLHRRLPRISLPRLHTPSQ